MNVMYWFDDRKLDGEPLKDVKTKPNPQCVHYKTKKAWIDVKRSIEGRTQIIPKEIDRVYCGADEHERPCGVLRKKGLCRRMNK